MDSLASAAFGMEVNSFNEDNSKFIQCAAALFKLSVVDTILLMLKIIVPGLSSLFETFNINIWKVNHQSQKNPVSASAMLSGKFLRIRKVFATSSLFAG